MSERILGSDCPSQAAKLSVNTTTSAVLQDSVIVPYPKAGTWFLTLTMSCFITTSNSTAASNSRFVKLILKS